MNGHATATRTADASPKTLSGDTNIHRGSTSTSSSPSGRPEKAEKAGDDALSHHLASRLNPFDKSTTHSSHSKDTAAASSDVTLPPGQGSVIATDRAVGRPSAQSSTSQLPELHASPSSSAPSQAPVAQIVTSEASDESGSPLAQSTSTAAADMRASIEQSSAPQTPLQSQQQDCVQSLDLPSLPSTPASTSLPPTTVLPKDPIIATVSAIKSRDFINSPLPARPAPTALGAQLTHVNSASTLTGIKGMASAPAVQTLSTISQTGVAGNSVEPVGTLVSEHTTPSILAPTASAAVRPQPVSSASSATSIRKPGAPGASSGATRMPPSLQAKLAAMAARSNNPTAASLGQSGTVGAGERLPTANLLRQSSTSAVSGAPLTGLSAGPAATRPMGMMGAPGRVSAMGPMTGRQGSTGAFSGGMPIAMNGIAKRRPGAGLSLAQMGIQSNESTSGSVTPTGAGAPSVGRANRPKMQLPPAGGSGAPASGGGNAGSGTPFSNFSKIVDPSGSLNFQNKAVLHSKGVDFSNGSSFKINMDELELQDELGSGNYGTVQKVFHKVTKVTMAMKEIRLELDDSKLKAIITELDILHRATAPEIVEFYGAFFIESCVYYCMEFMDAGSLDKFSGFPVPEPVLKRVTASMVKGLKFLKDKLQIMHRDVKPTNVLINTAGSVKLCDFGVSGQLERSLAKTNIGCQSYMAPERIKGESLNFLGTYTVSSDVWSLGLSIIEFARGHYPYPPETYSNVFAQLQAIVHGDPPSLQDGYSREADDFVARCLHKDANKRPSYAQLLQHPFLRDEPTMDVDMAGWVRDALAYRKQKKLSMNGSSPSSATPLSASSTSSASTLG